MNDPNQVYQGRLLASFQDDAKYEHVGQDTRSQGGKDDQDKQGKDLKISDIKTKSKDNDKGSRSKITKHEGTSLQRRQRQRSQELNDKSNLIDLMKECHNELTSGEIVSLKIMSRTMEVPLYEAFRILKEKLCNAPVLALPDGTYTNKLIILMWNVKHNMLQNVGPWYGYCKNLKKTVKTGQTQTREQKSTQRAGRKLSKVKNCQLKST
ncbi:hypothetical protein Tco_0974774 [Tanacetum coccineum]|uniref:Uncharacterized protein n=1 Tax=Tanacetum coccineum TaxID=301880 RepID=A0ABQ5ECP7_9ASTR